MINIELTREHLSTIKYCLECKLANAFTAALVNEVSSALTKVKDKLNTLPHKNQKLIDIEQELYACPNCHRVVNELIPEVISRSSEHKTLHIVGVEYCCKNCIDNERE